MRVDVEAQFAVLTEAGGAVMIQGEAWGWAFPLRAVEGNIGFVVVAADAEPNESDQFLLRMLAQQTGIALANARVHAASVRPPPSCESPMPRSRSRSPRSSGRPTSTTG